MSTKVETPIRAAARKGRAWTLPFNAVDPTGADDVMAVIKPTSGNPIEVIQVEVSSTVAGNLEPMVGTGALTGLTDVPCRNLGGGATQPKAEKGTGVDITGITQVGGQIGHYFLVADTPRVIDFPGGVRVEINESFALLWEVATGILSGNVTFFEIDEEDKN